MSIGLIAGAGIAIAASVGPAREWRGTMYVAPEPESPVERPGVIKSEAGVPGEVVPSYRPEVVLEHVPLADQLIKKPGPTSATNAKKHAPLPVRPKKPADGPPIPIVVITPPPEPEKNLAIPTNTSPVPPSTTQKTDQVQIKSDGPVESAPPQRLELVTTKGADGWNKVIMTKTGFAPTDPARAKYIDDEVKEKEAPFLGKPHIMVYLGIDKRDQNSSMTPTKEVQKLDVHDSQMHLFERAEQTQQRMEAVKQSMAGGDVAPMQKLFHDIPDAQAAANKMRVARGLFRAPIRTGRIYGLKTESGSVDPQLVRDENAAAIEAEILKLTGVDRFEKLLACGDADGAFEYLNGYLVENSSDGRAFAVLGLHQLASKKSESGLKNLAKACDFAASAFTEPVDLKAIGVSQSAVADTLSRLMGQKEQNKGAREATALAAASYAIGRFEAASKLLDQAVALGMDKAEAASLAALWKTRK